MSTELAQSGDVRIAYEVLGEGDPLLFIHGLGYDRHGWGPLPQLLSDDFGVVVFDNRGVGESDVPPGPYSVAELAADALAVLDAAGVERAHVLRLVAQPGDHKPAERPGSTRYEYGRGQLRRHVHAIRRHGPCHVRSPCHISP